MTGAAGADRTQGAKAGSANSVTVDGHLSLDGIWRIAEEGASIVLDSDSLGAVESAHREAAEIRRGHPVYGQSTGVGANKTASAAATDGSWGMRLLRSHAAGAGREASTREVRAMLVVRLNQLCLPGSGIDPEVVRALAAMLDAGALPRVRIGDSVGTGDLSALAATALTLAGERAASAPVEHHVKFGSDSALPFISSSALTIGRAALLVHELGELEDAALGAYALSCAVVRANIQPFEPVAVRALAMPEAQEVAARMGPLLAGASWSPRAIQDRYGLRAFLPRHAVVSRAIDRLSTQTVALANVSQENPLFACGEVLHHGGFVQAALAHELRSTLAALAQSTTLSLSRIAMLNDPRFSGLPAFLSAGPEGSSGTIILEYIAGGAAGEILAAQSDVDAHPVVLSLGMEEDASFAGTLVGNLERGVEAWRRLVAVELLEGARAISLSGTSEGLTPATRRIHQAMADVGCQADDHDLQGEVDRAIALVSSVAQVAVREAQSAHEH